MITELHIGTFTGTLFPQHPVLGGGVFPDGALVSVASEARGSSTEPIEAGPLPEGRSRKLERKLTSVENLTSKNYLPQIKKR